MKAEDREELQQNDLAIWMYKVPLFFKLYGSYILLAVALVVLGWRLWTWQQDKQAAELQQAWTSLAKTGDPSFNDPPDKLNAIIKETGNRSLQAFAYARLGKFYLEYLNAGVPAEGIQGVKIPADQAAAQAQDAFAKVIADYQDQMYPLAEARLGLAALSENRGQWDEARKQYESIIAKGNPLAESPFADIAQRHLSKLAQWSKPALLVAAPAAGPVLAPGSQPATVPAAPPTAPGAGPVIAPPAATHPAHP